MIVICVYKLVSDLRTTLCGCLGDIDNIAEQIYNCSSKICPGIESTIIEGTIVIALINK